MTDTTRGTGRHGSRNRRAQPLNLDRRIVACALVLGCLAGPAWAQAPAGCPVSSTHVTAFQPLEHSRAAVQRGRLTVLAVGSSSIEGVGASSPQRGFVPLLEAGLERRLPGIEVTVINRGIGGETTRDTEGRIPLQTSLTVPDVVVWQWGTNDVLRDRPTGDVVADFRRGADWLDRAGVDVLLIDPQRLPEDTDNPGFKGRNPSLAAMARTIADEARTRGYAVLARHAAMADWGALPGGGVGPDDLQLNDDGYACWAENTAEGLAAPLR